MQTFIGSGEEVYLALTKRGRFHCSKNLMVMNSKAHISFRPMGSFKNKKIDLFLLLWRLFKATRLFWEHEKVKIQSIWQPHNSLRRAKIQTTPKGLLIGSD